MSSLKKVYWSKGSDVEVVSFVPGVNISKKKELKRGSNRSKDTSKVLTPSSKELRGCLGNQPQSKSKSRSPTAMSKPHRASLKDLCPEDKQRVANLIRELAKAGEEKEATENKLVDERNLFKIKLGELQADKDRIEQEQKAILSQFKECQDLLVFYQKKITEEQKEVARDINQLLTHSPRFDRSFSPRLIKRLTSPRVKGVGHREQEGDITVPEDIDGLGSHSRRSAKDSRQLKQCNYTAGSHDENFLRPEKRGGSGKASDSLLSSSLPCGDNLVTVGTRKSPFQCKKRQADLQSPKARSLDKVFRPIHLEDNPRMHSNLYAKAEIGVYKEDLNKAFEERIGSSSPDGRRVALLKQKQQLEAEQEHLQKVLAEQEDKLRVRQEQLQKRHIEYSLRIRHFKKFGRFPSSATLLPDDVSNSEPDDRAVYDFFTSDSPFEEKIPGEDGENRLWKLGSRRRHRSKHLTSAPSDPFDKKHDFLADQSSDHPRNFSLSKKENSPSDEQPTSNDHLTSLEQTPVTSECHTTVAAQSPVVESSGLIEETKTNDFMSQTSPTLTSDDTSPRHAHTTDLTGLSPRFRESAKSIQLQEASNSFLDNQAHGLSPFGACGCGDKSYLAKSCQNASLSGTEVLSSTLDTPRRHLHNTMNNIHTLTDLISSVEQSSAFSSPRLTVPSCALSESFGSPSGDDTIRSVAFDPEDSKLLEDVFFVK